MNGIQMQITELNLQECLIWENPFSNTTPTQICIYLHVGGYVE